ncbi:unnamed protein product [Mesocestoides corti]|nr:unnamed protein product [Mesocestoides corti]
MPPKGKKGPPKVDLSEFQEGKVPPTAVIVAEDVANRFEPLSSSIPHSLLPLANVPLLHFSLSRLVCDGFQNIIIYACRDANKIRAFVESNAYTKRMPQVTIKVVNGHGSRCLGDVMRDLEGHQLLRGVEEFICLPADLVCDVDLSVLLSRFRERRSEIPSAALDLVYADLPYFAFPDAERLSVVFTTPDMKLIQSQRYERDMPVIYSSEVLEAATKLKKLVEVRSRLLDPRILLCSSHIPPLFQDNFDYDSIDDLVHGILTNEEIMGYSIHLQFTPPSRLVLPAAPTLSHLLDITPRLLTRLGGTLVRPPNYLSTDPFSRLTEGIRHSSSRAPPVAVSLSCYIARTAHMHPSARLIGACLIGENCHVDSDAVLIDTVLGDNCTVLSGARLRGVVALSDVYISHGVVADKTWICSGAWIHDSVRLGPRCFIGAPLKMKEPQADSAINKGAGVGVTLGPNVQIPPESILVAPGPNDVVMSVEECGSRGWAAVYQPSSSRNDVSLLADDENASVSGSDLESSDDQQILLWRTGWAPRHSTRSCTASRLYSGVDDSETSRLRMRSSGGDFDGDGGGAGAGAESDRGEDGDVSDEFLIQELKNTLIRSVQLKQPTDVVLLEVNSLKHAYNISLEDLAFFLIKALLDIAEKEVDAEKREDARAFAVCFKIQLSRFAPVLEKYLASSETCASYCLQAVEDQACYHPVVMSAGQWLVHGLYDADLVSEEAIREWVKASPLLLDEDLSAGCSQLRENLAPFLKWLDEADEEDDED